ncbi:hypothetical protein EMQ25_00105 [Arsenicitalea aurantiaca]|uniref:DUF4282 domain-containing protein n=1 Tax=Arsenicitalea aurantiaca TaxID=1783274 RepID=A0A433XK06_9HYPH|nr:hypothetical protein [Arsenicitalea aurantiaca]RUT34403.1 hypothetical protein EMQ25_00105 [Arsenicitalea aurantiaca]
MVFVFFILGLLGILSGGLLAFVSLLVALRDSGGDMRILMSALVIINLLPGLGIMLGGLILMAIGRMLSLLRRIAENTYELQFSLVPPSTQETDGEREPQGRQRDFWR